MLVRYRRVLLKNGTDVVKRRVENFGMDRQEMKRNEVGSARSAGFRHPLRLIACSDWFLKGSKRNLKDVKLILE